MARVKTNKAVTSQTSEATPQSSAIAPLGDQHLSAASTSAEQASVSTSADTSAVAVIESPPDHAKAQSGESASAQGVGNAGDGTPARLLTTGVAQMKPYTVLSPLDFNNHRYEVDSEVDLDDETAKPLLDRVVSLKH